MKDVAGIESGNLSVTCPKYNMIKERRWSKTFYLNLVHTLYLIVSNQSMTQHGLHALLRVLYMPLPVCLNVNKMIKSLLVL